MAIQSPTITTISYSKKKNTISKLQNSRMTLGLPLNPTMPKSTNSQNSN